MVSVCGFRLVSDWFPDMVSDWFQTGFRMVSAWFPTGFRLFSDMVSDLINSESFHWFPTGFRLVSVCPVRLVQNGFRLVSDWFLEVQIAEKNPRVLGVYLFSENHGF